MDIPWPRRGDRLFRKGGRGSLAGVTIPDLAIAAGGYKTAADALVGQLDESGRDDSLLAPIIFCYRQYIELRLKGIIKSTRWLTGKEPRYVHDLVELWEPLRNELVDEAEGRESDELAVVDACIRKLNEVDPGTAFRYPALSTLKSEVVQVDLANLKAVVGRLAMFLDALHDSWEDV